MGLCIGNGLDSQIHRGRADGLSMAVETGKRLVTSGDNLFGESKFPGEGVWKIFWN